MVIIQFMTGEKFMQLLLLLILLALGGKTENLKEVQPLLESLGGEEMASAFKTAEEMSSVITAVQSAAKDGSSPLEEFLGAFAPDTAQTAERQDGKVPEEQGFPLAPIVGIADEGIIYSLSRYIATGN